MNARAISQKFPADGCNWVENTSQFSKDFIETYNEDRDEGYFLEVDGQNPEELDELYEDLHFLPERMKIERVEKPLASLHDKKEYVIHISIKSWISNEKKCIGSFNLIKKLY